jgi:Zn-finger nucleic acid-binding protein
MNKQQKLCPVCGEDLVKDYYASLSISFYDCYNCDKCFQERGEKLIEISISYNLC